MPIRSVWIACLCLVVLPSILSSQAAPAPQKVLEVEVEYEDLVIRDVVARLAKETGYSTIVGLPDDDEGDWVTLSAGKVPLDVACVLLTNWTVCTFHVHHGARLIEVRNDADQTEHRREVKFDFRKVVKVFNAGKEFLRSNDEDNEEAKPTPADYWLPFTVAVRHATGIVFDPRVPPTNPGEFVCKLSETEEKKLVEFIELLCSDSGGRSKWLQDQDATWERLVASKVTWVGGDITGLDFIKLLARQAKIKVILHPSVGGDFDHALKLDFKDLAAIDALLLVLEDRSLKHMVVGNLLMIVAKYELVVWETVPEYFVTDLAPLTEALFRDSHFGDIEQPGDVFHEVFDVLMYSLHLNVELEIFGTKLIVSGGCKLQHDVQQLLKVLGWQMPAGSEKK